MSNEDKTGKGFLDELESLSNDSEKKPKKMSAVDEVENLLKTTLSEVGINAEKLRASVKAMEAEKKKEHDEMDKLDSLLEPIHKPPHETAHDFLRSTVHETVHEPVREPVVESYHEPAREPVKEKEPFTPPRAPERAEIFEKPKPSEKDVFPPMPEKKPGGARPAPPLKRERLEAPAKKPDAIFDAYVDKPKKKFPVALVALAAVVIIGGASAAFLLKKSGKSAVVVEPNPIVTQTNASDSAESLNSTLSQNPAESNSNAPQSTPAEKTAAGTPASKRNANTSTPPASKLAGPSVTTQTGQATESTGAPSEPIQPIVPVTTPRVQEAKPAPTPTTAADNTAGRPAAADTAATAPPKKARLGDLIPLEQVDTQPVVQQKAEATYPALGRRMGIEGTVIVNALVSETGDVIRTNVIRKIQGGANYGFETASEDAVKKWKFKAAVKDGVSVKTWMPVAMVFRK